MPAKFDALLGQLREKDAADYLSSGTINNIIGSYVPYSGATSAVNLGANHFVTTGSIRCGSFSCGTSPSGIFLNADANFNVGKFNVVAADSVSGILLTARRFNIADTSNRSVWFTIRPASGLTWINKGSFEVSAGSVVCSGLTSNGIINVSDQLTSTLAIGSSPFNVTSTTLNTNLNADLLDGYHFSDIPTDYLKLDTSNDPLTGDLDLYKADPKLTLKDNTNDYSTTLNRLGLANELLLKNEVMKPDVTSRAVRIDAVNEYLTLPYTLNGASELTVASWIRNVTWRNYAGIVFNRAYGATGICLSPTTGQYAMYTRQGANSYVVTSNTLGATGQWDFVVGRFKNGEPIQIYVNGVNKTGATTSGTLNINQNWRVGLDSHATDRWPNARIEESVIWNRQLTDAEVDELYNAGLGNRVDPLKTFSSTGTSMGTSLYGLYHYDDDILDYSGNARHASGTGAYTYEDGFTFPSSVLDVNVINSQDGFNAGEGGIFTFGDATHHPRLVLDGKTTRFNVEGSEKEKISSSGHSNIDSWKQLFGTGDDASIFYDGTNFNINNGVGGGIIIENDVSDGDISFKVNDGGVDTTVMTIDGATSNVGIKTTAPTANLHVLKAGTIKDLDANTIAGFQNSALTSSIARASIIAGNAGQSRLDLGDTDSQYVGGVWIDHSTNTMGLRNAGADMVTILNSGYTGFNKANPLYPIDIYSTNNIGLNIDKSNAGKNQIRFTNTNPQIWVAGIDTNEEFVIADNTASTIPFTIKNGAPSNSIYVASDGKVGLGTPTPSEKLDVVGDIEVSADIHLFSDNGKALFGAADDASIYYDGTNLIINPKEVGTGGTQFTGNVGIGVAPTSTQLLYLKGTEALPLKIENITAGSSVGMTYTTSTRTWTSSITTTNNFVIRDVTGAKSPFVLQSDSLANSIVTAPTIVSINSSKSDLDFRVSSGSDTNLIYANAGTDRVGIGTSSPTQKFAVSGNIFSTGDISSAGSIIGSGLNIYGDANVVNNLSVSGNTYIRMPYSMLSSTETQIGSPVNTALPVTFNVLEDMHQMTLSGGSIVNIENGGDYLINVSAIGENTSATAGRIQIWPQINGSDVPRSNTIYDFKGQNSYAVIAVPYILDLASGDCFCMKFAANNDAVEMVYTGSTAYSPSTPSIIVTLNKLGEITP